MSVEHKLYASGQYPRCPCSRYVIQIHYRFVHLLMESVIEAGTFQGRDLRLEDHRINRSCVSRDRHRDNDGSTLWPRITTLLFMLRLLVWKVGVHLGPSHALIPRSDSPGFEPATFRVQGVCFTDVLEKNGCFSVASYH
jgi:hypothetical protein